MADFALGFQSPTDFAVAVLRDRRQLIFVDCSFRAIDS
jgi:hypothetical protein